MSEAPISLETREERLKGEGELISAFLCGPWIPLSYYGLFNKALQPHFSILGVFPV